MSEYHGESATLRRLQFGLGAKRPIWMPRTGSARPITAPLGDWNSSFRAMPLAHASASAYKRIHNSTRFAGQALYAASRPIRMTVHSPAICVLTPALDCITCRRTMPSSRGQAGFGGSSEVHAAPPSRAAKDAMRLMRMRVIRRSETKCVVRLTHTEAARFGNISFVHHTACRATSSQSSCQ